MKVYISGPMSGREQHNYPAFHAAAEEVRALGHEALNPAENFGGRTDLPYGVYMRRDIQAVLDCDCLLVLDGWENSRGAKLEVAIAGAIDTPIVFNAEKLRWVLDGIAVARRFNEIPVQPMRCIVTNCVFVNTKASASGCGERGG